MADRQNTVHIWKKILQPLEAICETALIRHLIGVTIIIWSSIRSRPSLRQSLPDRNTSCHPYRSTSFNTGLTLTKCRSTVFYAIANDNKLRWDSQTDSVYKTVSKRDFLLSKLRYIVDIDTRKLFLNVQLNLILIMHQLCGTDVAMFSKKRLNSLQIRAVKLIFPDTNTGFFFFFFFLMRIMWTNNRNITRVCSCTGTQSIYLTCIHALQHAILTLAFVSLVCLDQGEIYSKQA